MHVKILIECSFTNKELLRIICRCCEIAHEQVRISELRCKFDRIDKIAHEQIEISEFICRFDRIDEVAHEQIKISKLNVDLIKLTELLMSK